MKSNVDVEVMRGAFIRKYSKVTMIGGLCVWIKINIIPEKDENKSYKVILHRIEAKINERTLIRIFGIMRTDDETTRGCY